MEHYKYLVVVDRLAGYVGIVYLQCQLCAHYCQEITPMETEVTAWKPNIIKLNGYYSVDLLKQL
jgi:hypothetical protein